MPINILFLNYQNHRKTLQKQTFVKGEASRLREFAAEPPWGQAHRPQIGLLGLSSSTQHPTGAAAATAHMQPTPASPGPRQEELTPINPKGIFSLGIEYHMSFTVDFFF